VNLPLIVIGSVNTGLYIRDLLAYGVRGYLYECDPLQNSLTTAIEMVLRGHTFLSLTANADYLVAMRSRGRDWKLDAESRHGITQTPLPDGVTITQVVERCAAELEQAPRLPEPPTFSPFATLLARPAALARGRGFACGLKNVGYSFGFPERCEAEIVLHGSPGEADPVSAELFHGGADVGQGAHTAFLQMAA
jgi:hypothetical protein